MIKKQLIWGLLFVSFSLAAQSPWPRSKAGFFVQASWNFIPTYTTLFGKDADLIMEREVTERNLQLYGEYGLGKKTTLVAALPFVFNNLGAINPDYDLMNGAISVSSDSGTVTGLGNASLALRHQFIQDKWMLSGTLKVAFPAKANAEVAELARGYDAVTVLPMLSTGMGLGDYYWFAYGGYGYRSNRYSHFLNFGGELGIHFGKLWLSGFSETIWPLENGSRRLPAFDELTGLYINDQGWISIGLKAAWEITPSLGINVSGAGAAWAQYVPKSPGIGLGVYYKMD
jgi:hypothetical protein